MGIIDLPKRLKACNRQKLLWQLHCMEICESRDGKSNEPCDGCPIYEEFKEIGEILNSTVRERLPGIEETEILNT